MFLTPNDFTVRSGELFRVNNQGYSFVFYFTTDCKWCDDVKPAFNYLSKMIRGVNFAYMDAKQNNWQVVKMSEQTRMPITYVPLLLLFGNGKPIGQYFPDEDNPQNNIPKMQNFIISNTRQQNNQQVQSASGSSNAPQKEEGPEIPPYSIGIPGNLASRKVCKLFDSAYNK